MVFPIWLRRRPTAWALAGALAAGVAGGCAPQADAPGGGEPDSESYGAAVSELSGSAIAPEWCQQLPRAAYASLQRIPIENEWFEVYDVGSDVYALYEPMQWQEIISYLIVGSERALLFDTGMGISSISAVVSELTDLPVTVLNSHTHMDHIGGNAEFASVLAMDTEYTRGRTLGLSNELVRDEVRPEALCAPLPSGVTEETYRTRAFEVSEYVEDGRRIDLGDRTLEIIHIPGHTPDAIAVLDREAGYLWTGDSFYEAAIWLFAGETDLEAYTASVVRLAGLVPVVSRIFPAHNTPVAEPARLTELRDAVLALREGTLEGTAREDGLVEYQLSTFSLLLGEATPGGE